MSEEKPASTPSGEDDSFVPPATLEFLVASFVMQAEVHLGLWRLGPEQERPKPNLKMARHSIDMLAVLQEKTRGNLSLEEERQLENSLTELRFRYVQAVDEMAAAAGAEGGQSS